MVGPFHYTIDHVEIGRNILQKVQTGGKFSRADLVPCLVNTLDHLPWSKRKEIAEKLADLLVGAGVLVKADYQYWLAQPTPLAGNVTADSVTVVNGDIGTINL